MNEREKERESWLLDDIVYKLDMLQVLGAMRC